MPLIVGDNTYVDLAEANAYFGDRYGFDKWQSLQDADKEKLLMSAAQLLDMLCVWYGDKCTPTQKLAFPRTDHCPNVPEPVKVAQIELAYVVLDNGGIASTTSGGEAPISELKAGSVALKFDTAKSSSTVKGFPVPDLVSKLLGNFGLCASGGTRLIPIERQ